MAEMASFVSKIVLSYFSLSSKWEYEKSLLWLEIEKIIFNVYILSILKLDVKWFRRPKSLIIFGPNLEIMAIVENLYKNRAGRLVSTYKLSNATPPGDLAPWEGNQKLVCSIYRKQKDFSIQES